MTIYYLYAPETYAAVKDPWTIMRHPTFTLRIDDLPARDAFLRARLVLVLAATKAEPAESAGDLRWVLRFSDAKGRSVATIAVSRLTNAGLVDGASVLFDGDLVPWLRGSVLPLLAGLLTPEQARTLDTQEGSSQ